ncbi:CHAT domain-containing protein [Streptomyces sp. NPDC004111]|uniref:CHAT domain-containing protein n=1 Tax=Streptomyces sp. NPDC004111 TaxID=3364690 RepID=UPI0036847F4A
MSSEGTGHYATADLDERITRLRDGVRTSQVGYPARPFLLTQLAQALFDRAESTGDDQDSMAAVEAGKEAVQLTPEGHPALVERLNLLHLSLRLVWEHTGALTYLHEAEDVGGRAVEAAPADHAYRVGCLSSWGITLWSLYECTGDAEYLDRAVASCNQAIELTPQDSPIFGALHNNLSVALRLRFEHGAVDADGDRAVSAARHAVDLADGDEERAPYLYNLGGALQSRYEHTCALEDLEAQAVACQDAVRATTDRDPLLVERQHQLAVALHLRFQRLGEQRDLQEALTAARSAAQAVPEGHVIRGLCFTTLASVLLFSYETGGSLEDLDEAVDWGRSAVNALPEGHRMLPVALANLSGMLARRYWRTGSVDDLNQAVAAARAVDSSDNADQFHLTKLWINLGTALDMRYRRTNAITSLEQAAAAYARAADHTLAGPNDRITAAQHAATLLARFDTAQAAQVLEQAVRLLPTVAGRHLGRGDQQEALARFSGLAADAAALRLAQGGEGSDAGALQTLELGRAVLLSQALDARSDLTDLRQRHPELAARFMDLCDQLDQPVGEPAELAAPTTQLAGNDKRSWLARQLAAVLEEIRAQESFASFALPPPLVSLRAEAKQGPVVALNVSEYRSDALVLTTSGVNAIALPKLRAEELTRRADAFRAALHDAVRGHSMRRRKDAQAVLRNTLEWLWDSALEPVLEEMGFTEQPREGEPWPRVWWIAGGLLAELPLHAAGHQGDPADMPGRRTVMDRVVSSYTPSVRALGYARQRAMASTPARALVVALPTTPGLAEDGRLHYVDAEVGAVTKQLAQWVLLRQAQNPSPQDQEADGQLPTQERVLTYLPQYPVAHFACHGISDPDDPSHSRLLLHDHSSSPFTVAALTAARLESVQVAYLSACRSASIQTRALHDESIHLATAFQLAGVPRVVGTLWEVDDQVAAMVGGDFYTHLRAEGPRLAVERAAHALHAAVRARRDRFPRTPSLWAGYLHAGA